MEIAFTPTQRRILAVLADGEPHRHDELFRCINDEMAGDGTLSMHLSNLRKKLALRGETVVTISGGWRKGCRYQHVKKLNGAAHAEKNVPSVDSVGGGSPGGDAASGDS